jgi:hypothetical protein
MKLALLILALSANAQTLTHQWATVPGATHYRVTLETPRYTNSMIVRTNNFTYSVYGSCKFKVVALTNTLKTPKLKQ